MQPETLSTIATALVIIAVLCFLLSHARKKHRRDAEVHSAQLAGLLDQNTRSLQSVNADHSKVMVDHDMRNKAEISLLVKRREAAVRHVARGMKWELASRQALVRALASAHLDSVVATNVVFAANETSQDTFCAQIDHLVITENVVIIVDSKNWQGVIFDGVLPSKHAPTLGTLFDERGLGSSFAIQAKRAEEAATGIEVRYHRDKASPATQVRRQAVRFRNLLTESGASAETIRTYVFYSHPDALVVTNGLDSNGHFPTVITDREGISKELKKTHDLHPGEWSDSQREQLISVVQSLGADLIGTGKFADDFGSTVPLATYVDDRKRIVLPAD